MCIFALCLCETLCLHGKCHAFRLISLTARKIRFAPLPHVFAHWHIFPSIALCHSIEFRMHLSIWVPSDVCRRTFFFCHTPPHTELDPGAAPICGFYSFSVNSTSHFPALFLTAIIFSLSFCFSFSFLGSEEGKTQRKKMTKTQRREKKGQGKCRVRL